MGVYVISGGPGVGKTTIIESLRKRGFKVLEEAARTVAREKFPGKTIKEIDPKKFQNEIFRFQARLLFSHKNKEIVFSDRGLGDTIAYYKLRVGKVPKEVLDFAMRFRYSGIFILDFLLSYFKDNLRQEDEEEAKKIHGEIINIYRKLGYKPVLVPSMSVEKRVNFILSKINKYSK